MSADPDDDVARAWGGRVAPLALAAIALVYFGGIFAECIKTQSSGRILPAPLMFFTQVAGLFTHSARFGHEYRAEGWVCRDKRWAEIDALPYFPIDPDNKENRFYRAIHFYYELQPNRPVMQALDEFIVSHYNADVVDQAATGRGARERIGGVRFVKIKLPFGQPGDGSKRYERLPIDGHPADMRTDLYYTKESKRGERCEKISR